MTWSAALGAALESSVMAANQYLKVSVAMATNVPSSASNWVAVVLHHACCGSRTKVAKRLTTAPVFSAEKRRFTAVETRKTMRHEMEGRF